MDKELRFKLTGVDQSASKTITGVGEHGSKTAASLSSTFGKASRAIGGEVGEVLAKMSEGFEGLAEHGMSVGQKIAAAGALAASGGMVLVNMGAKEKQATDQLNVAIDNTGKELEDADEKIEGAVKSMEKYGDTAVTTKNALTVLTNATHDPEKALNMMKVAADLAAASHISLDAAAGQLAKSLNGSGRLFKQYGITVKENTDGTKDYAGAVDQLAQVVNGQADAAADNFRGKLAHLRAEVEDNVAAFGEKYGPAITGAGVAMIAFGPIVGKGVTAIKGLGSSFTATAVEAEVADAKIIAGNEAVAASNAEVAASARASKAAMLGGVLAIAAVAAGGYVAGKSLSNLFEKGNAGAHVMEHMGDSMKSLNTALVNAGDDTEEAGKQWVQAQLASTGLADKAAKAGITVDQMTEAITGGSKSTAELIKKWQDAGAPAGSTTAALGMLTQEYARVTGSVKKTTEATEDNTAAAITNKMHIDAQRQAVELWDAGLQHLGDTQIAGAQTEDAFLDSLDNVTQAVKDNGTTLDQSTDSGRKNRESLLSGMQAALSYAEAQRANGGQIKDVTKKLNDNVAQLERTATNAGLSKDQVHALIVQMGLTPKQIATRFKADTAPAYAAFNKMVADLRAQAANSGIIVSVNAEGGLTTTRGGTRFNASGTDFSPGGSTTIAERETEIVTQRGDSVTPLSKLMFPTGSTSAGGDVHVHLTVQTLTTDAASQRALVSALEGAIRTGYKIRGLASASA